jgi:putative acetyltransferase
MNPEESRLSRIQRKNCDRDYAVGYPAIGPHTSGLRLLTRGNSFGEFSKTVPHNIGWMTPYGRDIVREQPMNGFQSIRAAGPAEIPAVRELFCEYATGTGLDLCFQNFEEELQTLPGKYAEPGGRLYLMFFGMVTAGCGALRPFRDDIAEMKRLYVKPAFRERGFGRLLSERLIAEARRIGYRAVYLDTLATMVGARALYAKLGFVECEPYYDNPHPNVSFLKLSL